MNSNSSFFYRKGIRARLIIAFVGIGVLPFLMVGFYFSWHNFAIQKNQIADQQSTLTSLAAQSISSFFHEQKHLVDAYIKINFQAGIEQDNLEAKLREFLAIAWDEEHHYVFNAAYLIDEHGDELSHASRLKITTVEGLQNLSELDEFRVPFNKKADYFGPIYFDPLLAEPLMKIALPITDKKTARSVGVFVAVLRLKSIWNLVAQLNIGDHRVAYVLNNNGAIVAHKNPSIVLSNIQLPSWDKASVSINSDNRKVLQTTERIKYAGFPLYMVIESPIEKSYIHIYKEFTAVTLFLVIALLCATIVGLFVLRKIISPIEEMSAVALEIAKGDYSKRAKHATDDELGDLAAAFNAMTNNLVGSIRREEHEKKFVQSAIEALTHPFIVFDAKDYRVVLENSAGQMHGFTESCVSTGMRYSFDKVIHTKGPVTIEHVCNVKAGEAKCYEINAYPVFDNQNNVVQVIGYIIDATEKKALESQLRQARKLEALGGLASGVAHDFNNLLTGIIGYAELTLKKLPADSPLRNGIETILESGEKGADLTGQLLTFSRKNTLESTLVKPMEIINAYSNIIKGLIGDEIKLDLNIDSDLWNIKADAGQINQLLVNLSINARDAMLNGGVLTINVLNAVLADDEAQFYDGLLAGRYLKIIVADTGVGMSADVIERIFEPFFTTKKHYGTGLGMAIVYGVVKQHGGAIKIESEVGKGTRVTLLFPATDEVVEDNKNAESVSLPEGDEVVLIVDDDLSVIRFINDVLLAHGYTSYTASSADEALDICAKTDGHIDLLLTDVVMLEMTGQELADIINQKYAPIKTMFMSGRQDDELTNWKIYKGEHTLISKPIRVESLLFSIRSVLDGD